VSVAVDGAAVEVVAEGAGVRRAASPSPEAQPARSSSETAVGRARTTPT
jgi:hypothetical protein